MARLTKAQRDAQAALAAEQAQPQAPWAFPKAADFDAAQQAGQASAANAFFASRIIAAQNAQPESDAEISDDDLAAQQAAAEQAFDKTIEDAMKGADDAAPARGSKKPYIKNSSIAKPTKKVWAIADAMILHAEQAGLPCPTRGEIIAECIARGIASGTSATQYQYWKKASGR